MVLPTFQPSNAGAQLQQQTLGLAEGFQNIYARAEAIKQSRERLDMEKQRFAQEATFAVADTKEREARLKEITNRLELQDKSRDANLRKIDLQKQQTEQEIKDGEAVETLFTQLPEALKRIENISPADHDGLLVAHGDLLQRFGALSQGKTAARFMATAGPAMEALNHRIGSSQVLLERFAARAAFRLRTAINTGDTQKIAAILADPLIEQAATSPAKSAADLNGLIDAANKELMARQSKVLEKQAEATIKSDEKSAELSVAGFTGRARSKEAAKDVATEASAANSSVMLITELEDILSEIREDPAKLADAALRGRAANISKLIQATNRLAIVGPGAVTEAEWKILEQFAENPTNTKLLIPFFQERAKSGFETTREALLMKLFNAAESQGLKYDPAYWSPDAIKSRKQAMNAAVSNKAATTTRKLPDGSMAQGEIVEQNGKKVFKTTDKNGATRYFSVE